MQDSEPGKPELTEPSPELLKPPAFNVSLADMTQSHMMLLGFIEALQAPTTAVAAKHSRDIALGMDFLQRMIQQSKMQLEMAKAQEKELQRRAKAAIIDAGGKLNGSPEAA